MEKERFERVLKDIYDYGLDREQRNLLRESLDEDMEKKIENSSLVCTALNSYLDELRKFPEVQKAMQTLKDNQG